MWAKLICFIVFCFDSVSFRIFCRHFWNFVHRNPLLVIQKIRLPKRYVFQKIRLSKDTSSENYICQKVTSFQNIVFQKILPKDTSSKWYFQKFTSSKKFTSFQKIRLPKVTSFQKIRPFKRLRLPKVTSFKIYLFSKLRLPKDKSSKRYVFQKICLPKSYVFQKDTSKRYVFLAENFNQQLINRVFWG